MDRASKLLITLSFKFSNDSVNKSATNLNKKKEYNCLLPIMLMLNVNLVVINGREYGFFLYKHFSMP